MSTITGTSGNDVLIGASGDDIINGLTGSDTLQGDLGSDTYLIAAGDGSDELVETSSGSAGDVDVLSFTDLNAANIKLTKSGNDLLATVKGTTQVVKVDNYFLVQSGRSNGVEQIQFVDGITWDRSQISLIIAAGATKGTTEEKPLFGTSGADTLTGTNSVEFIFGGSGNDTFNAHKGGDTVYGDLGSDTYLYTLGDGNDKIFDNLSGSGSDIDTVTFTNINSGGVKLSKSGNDLVLTAKSNNQTVTVKDQYIISAGDSHGIEQITFSGGAAWSRSQIDQIISVGATLGGSEGAPIFGTSGADTLSGTSAAEFMFGQLGSDTYVIGSGGNDTIVDNLAGSSGDTDLLSLTGLNNDAVKLTQVGFDLVATGKTTGQTITIKDYFVVLSGASHGIEQINFANSTSWTRAQMDQIISAGATLTAGEVAPIFGTSSGEILNGTNSMEFIFAGAGADTINGNDGNDVLYAEDGADFAYGGSGNDTLYGGNGDDWLEGGGGGDTLRGGVGSDSLIGRSGNDTYLIANGDGNDGVADFDTGSESDIDVLKFTDLTDADIKLSQSPSNSANMLATVKASGSFTTLINQLAGNNWQGVEQINFSNGVTWTRAQIDQIIATGTTLAGGEAAPIFGTSSAETLNGTSALESIFASSGNDTVYAGAGNDRVYGEDGDDALNGGNDADSIYGGNGNDTMNGNAGDDYLAGGANDDIMTGGTGDDILYGALGSDHYLVAAGDGNDTIYDQDSGSPSDIDILSFTDLNSDAVQLTQSGVNMYATVKATGQYVLINSQFSGIGASQGIEQITFADGATWSRAQIAQIISSGATLGSGEGAPIFGTSSGETLTGTSAKEFVFGAGGADAVSGGDGDDHIYGEDGADTLLGGLGVDTMTGGPGIDSFAFQNLADSAPGAADFITDFVQGTDIIDLSAIDADVITSGDQAFTVVSAFTNSAGQAVLSYNSGSNISTLSLDVDGDGITDFNLQMAGNITSTAGWLL